MRSRLKMHSSTVMAVLAALAITICAIAPTRAQEIEAGSLNIAHPRTRPTLGNVMITAVYLVIANAGDEPDTLLSVGTDIAERSEIHETVFVGDMARMQPIEGGVVVPAGDAAEFAPLGKHIMLIGLTRKLKAGDTFPLKLVFEKQGEVMIDVIVAKPKKTASPKPPKGSHHGSH